MSSMTLQLGGGGGTSASLSGAMSNLVPPSLLSLVVELVEVVSVVVEVVSVVEVVPVESVSLSVVPVLPRVGSVPISSMPPSAPPLSPQAAMKSRHRGRTTRGRCDWDMARAPGPAITWTSSPGAILETPAELGPVAHVCMRVLPRIDHCCHVCAHTFAIFQRVEWSGSRGSARTLSREPEHCPSCAAPLRFSKPLDVGGARGLLLLVFGHGWYVDNYGDVGQYLLHRVRTPEELDEAITFAVDLDLDAFAAHHARRRGRPSKQERAELATVSELRTAVEAGTLRARVEAAAASFRAELVAERARHGSG